MEAKRQLEQLGWLEEGLKQKKFPRAGWQGMVLPQDVDLTNADLSFANLTTANLFLANLMSANLLLANLTSTILVAADLTNTVLEGANLTNTDMGFANLINATLSGTRFDENTTLPDDTKWTPDTDMTRFTDPHHPKFWRSDDPISPAYGGDKAERARL